MTATANLMEGLISFSHFISAKVWTRLDNSPKSRFKRKIGLRKEKIMGDGGLKKNTETWTLMYRAQSRTYGVKNHRPSNAYLHMHVYIFIQLYLGMFRWYFTREKKKAKTRTAQNLGNRRVINRTNLLNIIRAKFR